LLIFDVAVKAATYRPRRGELQGLKPIPLARVIVAAKAATHKARVKRTLPRRLKSFAPWLMRDVGDSGHGPPCPTVETTKRFTGRGWRGIRLRASRWRRRRSGLRL